MLDQLVNQTVVIDLASPYVCMGLLVSFDEQFLLLRDADVHDLRDSDTTRENYVASSATTGIKRNRQEVMVSRRELVAIGRFDAIVDE